METFQAFFLNVGLETTFHLVQESIWKIHFLRNHLTSFGALEFFRNSLDLNGSPNGIKKTNVKHPRF